MFRSFMPCLCGGMVLLAACEGAAPLSSERAPEVEPHVAAAQAARGGASIASMHESDHYYTDLTAAAASGNRGSLHLSVETAGTIPRFPDAFIGSVPVFGYGWVDVATGDGVVAVIHPVIGRDSNQNPDGWHTHPVTLADGNAFDFCIASIGASQGGISIVGASLRLSMAGGQAGLAAEDVDVAASFIVQLDGGCSGLGLGVQVLDAEPI